ncbi:MAG: hypothetical protein U5M53_03045 [Rhodoferax sp.]|nr:hypothetical protein [Rhodoferax sp.]
MAHRPVSVGPRTTWNNALRLGLAIALISTAGFAAAQTDTQRYAQAQQMLLSGQHAAAAQVFRQLATQGDAASQFQLSLLYRSGRGVAASTQQSLQWLQRSARSGYAAALSNLGGEYAKGQLLREDNVKALTLFLLAQARGLEVAGTNAQTAARTLSAEQIRHARTQAQSCLQSSMQPCL